jgi:Fur family transcriptional regulator, peroxide stress response regulator
MTGEAKYKRSRQRERILELLKSTDTHPTAGWVYDRLKQEFKDLSMGTVYRNLNILLDQGQVTKIDFGSTFDRFDGNVDPHYHFLCEGCKAILDLPMAVDESLNQKVNTVTGYKTRSHRIEFFGKCNQCASRP